MSAVTGTVHHSSMRLSVTPAVRRLMALVGLVIVVALGGASVGSAAHAETASAPVRQVVVQRGDTLSQIAVDEMPHLSVGEAIFRIQQANKMSTTQVSAGQTIVIPS